MGIKDLDQILKKDPIIATFSTSDLTKSPSRVFNDYLVHAKTHLSLGDTATYVDKIFKWVSGENKGTFIGAVLGDYGEGKTSFQVHVWEQSFSRKVLAVPPFQWSRFEDIVEAVAGWVKFSLETDRPDLAFKVQTQLEKFKSNTIDSLAAELAKEKGYDFETAYKIIQSAIEAGKIHLTGLSATRVLDFFSILTDIINDADYVGLLVLLDEPEVAAKQLGNEAVQGFIFELADLLQQRQGNYGVFLSMPQNFYASCSQKFQSLPARLDSRKCFPVLSDIFGVTFANDLWVRYIDKFELGEESKKIVDPWALRAIGQIGSADCRHLSYGPRSVVSAFNSMVDHYQNKKSLYTAQNLLEDIRKQEIMIKPEYRSILGSVFSSQDITDENQEAVEFMAVFPLGLRKEDLKQLGFEPLLRPLTAGNGLIQLTAQTMGLRRLKATDSRSGGGDILEEMIQEFDAEFSPGLKAKKLGIKAFVDFIIPELFPKKRGTSLVGWSDEVGIKDYESGTLHFGVKVGAFDDMSKTFPSRAALVAVGSGDADFSKIKLPKIDFSSGPVAYDLLFYFILHETHLEDNNQNSSSNLSICKDNKGTKLIKYDIHLDLVNCTLSQEYLASVVGEDRITPLWLLGLLGQLSKQSFPMEYQTMWDVIKQDIIRDLKKCFFGLAFSSQIQEVLKSKYDISLSEAGIGLLDKATAIMLDKKYPEYSTLIRQPQWNQRVIDYISALQNENVPLECKRGKKVWHATSQDLTTAFRTSLMNISGGAFDNFDNLIKIESPGRDQPREVHFYIHPFEQAIYDFINSEINEDRIKVDHVECPYVSIRVQLLDWLKEYGYTVEELKNVIDIGIARKTFEKIQRQGEDLLFSRPLDLEGLKDILRVKLSSFEVEVKQMEKISWYRQTFRFDKGYKDIENIKVDTDYDGLNRFIDGFRNEHRNQLNSIGSRFVDEIDRNIISPLQSSKRGLNEDRRIASLRVVEAKSVWVRNLNEFIVPNFQRTLGNIRAKYDEIQRKSEQLKARLTNMAVNNSSEMILLFVNSYDEYCILHQDWQNTYEDVKRFFQDLKYFDEWLKFKNESDEIYTRLIDLKNNQAHKEKAEEFLMEFSSISDEIENHLRLMNVGGLQDAQRFLQGVRSIEKKRDEYLLSLKIEFNNQKNKINELFTLIKIEPLKNVFDQSSIKQSYNSLYQDAVDKIRKECLSSVRTELNIRQMDILYATNILNTINVDNSNKLLLRKEEVDRTISEIEKELSVEWLKNILSEGHNDISVFVKNAYLLSDEFYRVISTATKPKELSDGNLIELNKQIEKEMEVDLKDLILFMSRRIQDPKVALDQTLSILSELFKSNNVEIKVKYRRR